MIKFVWFIRYPDHITVEEGEKWVLGVHTQEVKHASGIRKYQTWNILNVLERPTKFVRLTEVWWDDLDSWKKGVEELAIIAPTDRIVKDHVISEPVLVNAEPDIDLMRHASPPKINDEMIKFVWLFRYPDGVSIEEGENWYLNVHTQQIKHLDGLRGYYTWKVKDIPERPTKFVRLTELWWDDLDSWRKGMVEHDRVMTPAPWGNTGIDGLICEPVCVHVKRQYDYLKDITKI